MKISRHIFPLSLGFLVAFFVSCNQNQNQQHVISPDSLKEHLINANKIMVKDESKEIDEFISRHPWKMNTTGTGLRYEIYQHGNGKKADEKKEASLSYSVYLFDGTLCYSADEKKPLTIRPGHGEQTRGLEEGILLMQEGDKARFVVPAHLGYGMTGDDNKIPRNSPLYYEVTLLKVKDTKE